MTNHPIIGIDAKRAYFNSTGLGTYSRTLIEALLEHHPEADYRLYAPQTPRNRFEHFEKNVKARCAIVCPSSFLGKAFPSLWRSLGIAPALKRDRVSLYHGLSHEIPRGLKKRNIPSVVTIHDIINLKYPQFYGWLDRQIYSAKLKYACEQADHIIADSLQTKADILDYFKVKENRCTVVPLVCDTRFEKIATTEEKEIIRQKYNLPDQFILYVGSINERKNLLSLIKAFERIKNRKGLRLVAIGNGGAYKKQVRQYVSTRHLDAEVRFPVVAENSDLPPIYQMASVFAYPSFYEGFGLPVLEALWSGLPVVTSKGSCLAEAGGPGALYIDPHKPDEIAEALEQLLTNSDLRKKLIHAGLEHAAQFTSRRFADQTWSVYQSL